MAQKDDNPLIFRLEFPVAVVSLWARMMDAAVRRPGSSPA